MKRQKKDLYKGTLGFKKEGLMKIKVLSIMLLTSISLLGFTIAEPISLDSGLVAYYPFNGNANNAAGSTGHGQLVGDVSFIDDRFGEATSAVRFSSDSSYIVFQESEVALPMGNAPRSFSLWIKSGRVETVYYLLCYGTEQPAQMCHFDIVHDRPRFQFGYSGFSLMGQSIITDNHWHHIACVFDGTYAKIYVDSKWDNEVIPGETIDQVNTTPNETGIWTVAIQQTLLWGTYIGSMDDIRIYGRALSEEEILSLYDCPTEPINQKIPQSFPQLTQSRDADLQKILDDEVRDNNVFGLSAAVVTPDWQWQGASGRVSVNTGQELTTDMLFRTGRPMNTYIAALVLELAEEGQLSLDDSLHKWLLPYPKVDSTITIRQLLSHTSGVGEYEWNDDWGEEVWLNPTRIFTPEELLLGYLSEPYFLPGESSRASGTNYLLLGLIIESIIDSNVAAELRTRYLEPLNLDHTFFPLEEAISGPIAHEHADIDPYGIVDYTSYTGSSNAINSSWWTAGAMYATAMDFAQWVYALLSGEVISQNALEQMLTFDYPFPYDGLGVLRYLLFKRVFIGNGGPTDVGYRSDFIFSQQDQICINIFNNYWPGDLGPCSNKLLYTTLVYKNQLPSPRFKPMEMDIGTVVSGFPVIDTSFVIYNEGVATDHIYLSVDYSNLDSSALTVEPMAFELTAGSSQQVSISIDPSTMNDTTYYRPKISIHSDNDLILPAALTERIYFSNNMPSGITGEKPNRLPDKYMLYPNYPNPFYASTRIAFELTGSTKVKLVIYDLSGRQVRLLTNSVFRSGKHSVVWNGHDDEGKAMASGLYFVHLQVDDHILTRKIMMLK
jgi:CubicO group peptidase (beta-lactamase class C family)